MDEGRRQRVEEKAALGFIFSSPPASDCIKSVLVDRFLGKWKWKRVDPAGRDEGGEGLLWVFTPHFSFITSCIF